MLRQIVDRLEYDVNNTSVGERVSIAQKSAFGVIAFHIAFLFLTGSDAGSVVLTSVTERPSGADPGDGYIVVG